MQLTQGVILADCLQEFPNFPQAAGNCLRAFPDGLQSDAKFPPAFVGFLLEFADCSQTFPACPPPRRGSHLRSCEASMGQATFGR